MKQEPRFKEHQHTRSKSFAHEPSETLQEIDTSLMTNPPKRHMIMRSSQQDRTITEGAQILSFLREIPLENGRGVANCIRIVEIRWSEGVSNEYMMR